MIPNNARIPRLTAAAGTKLADPFLHGTFIMLFPYDRALRPEGLHHSRGVAASGFSPIVQYSLLLPPVGVWTVSQFQCG